MIDGKTGALLFETFFYSKEHPQVFPFDEYLNSLEGKAQKKNRDFSILDTAFETFDYSEFERQNKKYKGVDKNGFEEEFTFDDGTKVLADTEEVFVLPKKDFYVGYKAFYKNGYIKEKGRYFGIFELNVKSIKIGKWYYFDESGLYRKGWIEDKGLWYYLDANGEMVTNTTVDGYNINADGVLVK